MNKTQHKKRSSSFSKVGKGLGHKSVPFGQLKIKDIKYGLHKLGVTKIPSKISSKKSLLLSLYKNIYNSKQSARQPQNTQNLKPFYDIQQKTNKYGLITKHLFPEQNLVRSEHTWDEWLALLTRIDLMTKSHRYKTQVLVQFEDGNKRMFNIKDLIDREDRYSSSMESFALDYQIISIKQIHLPIQGSCDTDERKFSDFILYNEDVREIFKYMSLKSKGNNCGIQILRQASQLKTQNDKIRKELGFQRNIGLDIQQMKKVSDYCKVGFKIFAKNQDRLELIGQHGLDYENIQLIFFKDCHYFLITQLPISIDRKDQQVNLQNKNQEVIGQNAYNYKKILKSPEYQQIVEEIEEGRNLLLIGQAGSGKSTIIKKIQEDYKDRCIVTGTTGQAAILINGMTLDLFMILYKKQPKKFQGKDILIVDECSMLGECNFDKMLSIFSQKMQIILVGDMIQLPPVKQLFFFESEEYQSFQKNTTKILLEKIYRQKELVDQQFLQDLRIGKLDKKTFEELRKNVVQEPDAIIVSKNDIRRRYNDKEYNKLQGQAIKYKSSVQRQDIYDIKEFKSQMRQVDDYIELKVGCKVMVTKNIDLSQGLYNGTIGYITELKNQSIVIQTLQGQKKQIDYVLIEGKGFKIQYLPVMISYAITVHKAQGETLNRVIFDITDVWEKGQLYVGLSRVRDLKNLQIIGKTTEQALHNASLPNEIGYNFQYNDEFMSGVDRMLVESTLKIIRKNKILKWEDPVISENNIFIDFETRNDLGNYCKQKAYYNKIRHHYKGKVIFNERYFDELWQGGKRCNVEQETWKYCKKTLEDYANNLKQLQEKIDNNIKPIDNKKIQKNLKKCIPTLCAYNGSGFDFHFLVKQFLTDFGLHKRFAVSQIYKGSQIIFLQVVDKKTNLIVFRVHDMCQVLGGFISLKKALESFCKNQVNDDIVKKIEFKDEILYILNNYSENPEILKPDVFTQVTSRKYTSQGIKEEEIKKDGQLVKSVCLYDEVIKYADNDVDVLPILYSCLDKICKQALGCNIKNFITAGSMAWYGFITNLPEFCLTSTKWDKNNNKNKTIESLLYRMEQKEVEYTNDAKLGGRVCPRKIKYDIEEIKQFVEDYRSDKFDKEEEQINQDQSSKDQELSGLNILIEYKKYLKEKINEFKQQGKQDTEFYKEMMCVYLDISGMYVSIMKNEFMPYGKSRFFKQNEIIDIQEYLNQLQGEKKRKTWRQYFDKITKYHGMFIAEIEFEDNKMNPEPVVQFKHQGTTKYTVQKRTQKLSSVDISIILASGGTVHNIKSGLVWQYSGKVMSKWMDKTLEIKNEGTKTGNEGLKAFGKLLGNATYGQSLKTDKQELIQFVNTYEQANDFMEKNVFKDMFEMGDYDIFIGKKIVDKSVFVSSRCQQLGIFILAYTRAMVFDICEVAMPNRYNSKGKFEQPYYGDTDSLVLRKWQADLLIKAGWVKLENGKLTDELGEESHWFVPERLKHMVQYQIPKLNTQCIENKISKVIVKYLYTKCFDGYLKTKIASINEQIWEQATEEEKRDPDNFYFYYVTNGLFAGSKSYSCGYQNNDGSINKDKSKFKGIPTTGLIEVQQGVFEPYSHKSICKGYELAQQMFNLEQTEEFKQLSKKEKDLQDIRLSVTLQDKPQMIKRPTKEEGSGMFSDIIGCNFRKNKFVHRKLFKTQYKGRIVIDNDLTLPYGYGGVNQLDLTGE